MSLQEYSIYKLESVIVTTAAAVEKVYPFPNVRGKGFIEFYFEMSVDVAGPTLSIEVKPAFSFTRPQYGDKAMSEYTIPVDQTLAYMKIYKFNGTDADFNAVSVADDELYMCYIDDSLMGGRAWNSFYLKFTAAVQDVTVTPYVSID